MVLALRGFTDDVPGFDLFPPWFCLKIMAKPITTPCIGLEDLPPLVSHEPVLMEDSWLPPEAEDDPKDRG